MPPAAPAGVLIDEAMTRREIGNQTLARMRLAETNGHLAGAALEKRLKTLRRQIQKWRSGPVHCLQPRNAEWVARLLGLDYAALVCKELTDDERRIRAARRLEAQARALRRGVRQAPSE